MIVGSVGWIGARGGGDAGIGGQAQDGDG